MTAHDKRLATIASHAARHRFKVRSAMLRGIRQMSFKPVAFEIKFGSLESDVRKIGADMRTAINQREACE